MADIPGSIAACMSAWASLTCFIVSASSRCAASAVLAGGFTMALLEWLILSGKMSRKRILLITFESQILNAGVHACENFSLYFLTISVPSILAYNNVPST